VAASGTPPAADDVADLRAAIAASGETDSARTVERLRDALRLHPGSAWLRFDLARALRSAGQPEAARSVLQAGLDAAPQDPDMILAAALQAESADDSVRAAELLARVPPPLRGDGLRALAARLDFAGALARMHDALQAGEAQTAAAALASAQALAPDVDARRRLEGSQRQLATLREAQALRVQAGYALSTRQSTAGISSLRDEEWPLRVAWSMGGQDRASFQADAVRLDAGTLTPVAAAQGGFGSAPAAPPLPGALNERSQGWSVGTAWDRPGRHLDIGLIGLGFPVHNWTGSWHETFTQGANRLEAVLSRRVQTGSLLAYSGAHDPVGGAVWGGAVETAASLRLHRELDAHWSLAQSVLAGRIDGRGLVANTDLRARTQLSRELTWPSLPGQWTAGPVLMLWHDTRNENASTLGQGGYYSPQASVSLGLEARWTGRQGNWSWALRAAPSYAWSRTDGAPAFPLDPALQQRAGNRVQGAGGGGGWAGSARLHLERSLDAGWHAGVWASVDRSAYYAPNVFMFYVRRGAPEGGGAAPERLVPLSQQD
jgi:hypothetical protein